MAMTDARFDELMDLWARWCRNGKITAGIGYPSCSIYLLEILGRAPGTKAPIDDMESEIESAVMALAMHDMTAARVIRAEYRATAKDDPRYNTGTRGRESLCAALGIKMRTYEAKLQIAKTAILTRLTHEWKPRHSVDIRAGQGYDLVMM